MPSLGIGELVYWALALSPQRHMGSRMYTHVEPRRSPSRILEEQHAGVRLPTNASTCEHFLVARVLVLPIVPNLINHLHSEYVRPFLYRTVDGTNRVVKEEHRIYLRDNRCKSVTRNRQLQTRLPFGDHFWPGMHPGGPNPNGHVPPISPPRIKCGPG
jgi:hypothetical protein